MNTRHRKLLFLLLETVGIAALFLPFTQEQSPWGELDGFWRLRFGWFWFLALPLFLAPLVCLQTLRSFFPRPLTRSEQWLGAGLVGLLGLVPLGWDVVHSVWDGKWYETLLMVLYYGLAVLAAGLLLTLKHRGASAQLLAPLALRCAYIPNAVYCLLGFSEWGRHWDKLQLGAACVGVTVALYLAEIVLLTRQGRKDRPTGHPRNGNHTRKPSALP